MVPRNSLAVPKDNMLIPVDDIKKILEDNYVVYVKYVRIGDWYRFALAAEWATPSHVKMADKDKPVSAGTFKLYRDGRFEWESGYSMTLRVGAAADDEDRLKKLFSCTKE
jgi:hypothetical protein